MFKSTSEMDLSNSECDEFQRSSSDLNFCTPSTTNTNSNRIQSCIGEAKNKPTLKGFQNLPRNIVVEIFSYFPEKEVSLRLAPVCRSWHIASQHPTLWKKLNFYGNRIPTGSICRMLRNAPLLQSVTFTRVPEILTVIRQLCRCNTNLKFLAIKYCTNENEVIPEEVFRNVISSCPNLRALNLKGTHFLTHRFCFELRHLQHLKSLDLSMNKFLGVHDLFIIVQSCRNLHELKLSRRINKRDQLTLTDQDAVFLFDSLKRSIHSLKFDLKYLGPPTIQAIFDCSKLTKLSLFNAYSLSGDLFRSLGKYLYNLTHLKICNASQLTSDDFCYVFANYKREIMNLVHLDVSGCWRLRDDGLKQMADTCSKNLQHLSIKCCKLITNVGVEYIINHCPNLKYLNIAHVNVNESCLNKLPSKVPQLKILIVDKSNTKTKMLTELRSSILDLRVKESISEYTKQECVLA